MDLLSKLDLTVNEHERYFAQNLTNEELEQFNTLLEKFRNTNNQ